MQGRILCLSEWRMYLFNRYLYNIVEPFEFQLNVYNYKTGQVLSYIVSYKIVEVFNYLLFKEHGK